MVRRKGRTFVLADTDEFAPVVAEPGFQTAYVQIGNVRITNSGLGSRVIQRRSAQQRPQLEEASESQSEESDSDSQGSSDEDADEEAVKDYLQNLAAQEQNEDENRDNEDGKGVQALGHFMLRDLEGDDGWRSDGGLSSTSDDSEAGINTGIVYEVVLDAETGRPSMRTPSGEVVKHMYPHIMRSAEEVRQGSDKPKKAKQKSYAKGAQFGKLRPGEKAQLRAEKIQAKRAARDAERGFDVTAVHVALRDFVVSGGDMLALPPAGKHGTSFSQQLAGLYGLKATLQGSGKKRFLMMQNTARSVLPNGKDMAKVEALLAKEIARQRMGASAYGVLGPQGMALTPHTQPYSSSKAARAAANTQQQQAAAGPGSIPTAVNGKKPSALSQPVSFVSSGLQSDVRGDKAAIVIAPPLAAAAVAVNAAAAASVLQATVIGAAEIAEIIPTDGQEALKDCSCTQCFGAESAEKDQPMQEEQEPSCSGMISECEGALIDKDGHNDGDGTAPTGLSIEDDYDEEYDKDALDASSSGTDTDGSTDAEQDTGVDDGGTLHFGLGMANPQRAWLAEAFGGQLGGLGFSGPVVRGPLAGFQVRSAAPGDVLVESLAAASLASPRIAAAGGSHVADLPAEAGPSSSDPPPSITYTRSRFSLAGAAATTKDARRLITHFSLEERGYERVVMQPDKHDRQGAEACHDASLQTQAAVLAASTVLHLDSQAATQGANEGLMRAEGQDASVLLSGAEEPSDAPAGPSGGSPSDGAEVYSMLHWLISRPLQAQAPSTGTAGKDNTGDESDESGEDEDFELDTKGSAGGGGGRDGTGTHSSNRMPKPQLIKEQKLARKQQRRTEQRGGGASGNLQNGVVAVEESLLFQSHGSSSLTLNKTAKQVKASAKKAAKDARRMARVHEEQAFQEQRQRQRSQHDNRASGAAHSRAANPSHGYQDEGACMDEDDEGQFAAGSQQLRMDCARPHLVPPNALNREFGGFERHTRGIGSKLLSAMGWSAGSGIGRAAQGRIEPIQPELRPKSLGLGAGSVK